MLYRSILAGFLSFACILPLAEAQEFVNWETPHVHPLDMTPDGALLLAVNTPDNRLELFDLTGSQPEWVDSIPVGLAPVSVRVRSDSEAWVVNHVSDSVSIVDLSLRRVTGRLDTEDEPCDVAFTSTGKAFVSCSQANSLLVFDLNDLSQAPTPVAIRGEDPRMLAVSSDGSELYAAIFESGNGTTALGGGLEDPLALAFPPNVVSEAAGPHGGVNPPPNDGAVFDPPLGAFPTPPKVSLIVRQDAGGSWFDDTGADWTDFVSGAEAAASGRPVGWTLLDHDVAIVDASTLTVTYAERLMNADMALGVNPVTGAVAVVGTEAINEVRFEPNLNGVFLRVLFASFDPAAPLISTTLTDLNLHVDYTSATLAQGLRDQSIGDPRGLAWNATGTLAYVTGMGSNNLVVVDPSGSRSGVFPTVEVGEGPTGIKLDGPRSKLYVLNKFESSISVVDVGTETELVRVSFFDPSPTAIKLGRKHLYDTHLTSGTGLVSCASCHVDARMDRLAWDLGDPSGAMKTVAGNLGANVVGLNTGFEDWHPMKGPMTTQTLQDIIGKEPHHWRGDRTGIEEFSGAFQSILGDDVPLSAGDMQDFEDFLATIYFPPNPYRELDNGFITDLALPGHFTTGRFGPAGQPLPNGDADNGRKLYTPPRLLDGNALACTTCHTRSTGTGTDYELVGATFQQLAPGPQGEAHHALVSLDGTTNVTMKIPQLRNMYEKVGFELTQLENVVGFGFLHDGTVDSLARFISEPAFTVNNDQEVADLVAFMISFSGHLGPIGQVNNPLNPPGIASQSTHAAVGKQLTFLDGTNPDPALVAQLDVMVSEAELARLGIIARGLQDGVERSWFYLGADRFQSDRRGERLTRAELLALAGPSTPLLLMGVPFGSEVRIGVDRDADKAYDGDELDSGTDPVDPQSRPKVRPRKTL